MLYGVVRGMLGRLENLIFIRLRRCSSAALETQHSYWLIVKRKSWTGLLSTISSAIRRQSHTEVLCFVRGAHVGGAAHDDHER